MQPYKRRRRTRRDMIVLGGWLFADLLLGLAMLFFAANTVGSPPPTPTPTATPNELATAQVAFEQQSEAQRQTIEAQQQNITGAEQTAAARATNQAEAALAATEDAAAEQTRQALSAEERAAADAQATQDAIAAEATIAAFATEQAQSGQTTDDLNSRLVTAEAQATQAALTNNQQATQVALQATQSADIAAVATQNAQTGANAQATINAQATAAQAALTSSQATVTAAQATVEAAQAQQVNVDQTAEASSLNPQFTLVEVQVDRSGVNDGDADARQEAVQVLQTALDPILTAPGCRAGFVLTSGGAGGDVGTGVQLADNINAILQEEFPEVFIDTTVFESIALTNADADGNVSLQIFLYRGCQAVQ